MKYLHKIPSDLKCNYSAHLRLLLEREPQRTGTESQMGHINALFCQGRTAFRVLCCHMQIALKHFFGRLDIISTREHICPYNVRSCAKYKQIAF